MDVKDATEVLSKAFASADRTSEDLESLHRAELDASYLPALLREPKTALNALGIKLSEESQVQVSLKNRASRNPGGFRARIIIVIIAHWRNCDSDIIIIVA
jgi:hypothetical protein